MELQPYRDTWDMADPHANFKAEVALYTVHDPLPTLKNLSASTGISVPALIRYVLVKYAASGADALLAMTPIVLRQSAPFVSHPQSPAPQRCRGEENAPRPADCQTLVCFVHDPDGLIPDPRELEHH